MSINDNDIQEKLKPFEAWKNKFKEKWKNNQKQVVFEDANGNVVTPTTTTTTTTTTTPKPTTKNVTDKYTHPSKFTPVVTVDDRTTPGAAADRIAQADTTELIKIVGITCGTLLALIVLILIVIRCCRKSAMKRNQRITVRRPLTEADREEHIYAEIEPLQATTSSGGASGTSADVQLPRKKAQKRRSGISSFRALSTRIYRFFSVDLDNQSVFYNSSAQRATVTGETPPEPPERNIANGKRTRRVNRGESTASRRPLLDGDSRTDESRHSGSSSVEARGNIYNPLLKDDEGGRATSGPNDYLALSKAKSGHAIQESEGEPASPHDYFALEKNPTKRNPEENIDSNTIAASSDLNKDSIVIENETHREIETIPEEEGEGSATPKPHDYFILEPHERIRDSPEKNVVSSKGSTISSSSSQPGYPVKEQSSAGDVKSKPEVTPRVTLLGNAKSPDKTVSSPEALDASSPYEVAKDIGDGDVVQNGSKDSGIPRSDSKEETYVLSKLGDAPQPPEPLNDNDYLQPKDVHRKPDYVDVFPNPPPRSTSLQPHELKELNKHIHDEKETVKTHNKKIVSPKTSPTHVISQNSPKSSPTKLPGKATKTSPKKVNPAGTVKSPSSPKHSPSVSPRTSVQDSSPVHQPASAGHKPVSPTKTKVETDI